RVRSTLYGLRQEVLAAYFEAASLQERAGELEATIEDLDARLREAAARVREGTALPSDTAALSASILQRRQDQSQLHADRRAALAVLGELTGASFGDGAVLALPDLEPEVTRARAGLGGLRARPEYRQYQLQRERLASQERAAGARELPRLSAF